MSETSLQSFAAQEANSFVDGPFGSDLKVSDYTDSGVRILQLQNLGDGFFIDKNLKFTSERKALVLNRCAVRPGDLIIAKMAEPLARACIIPDIVDRALIVADLIKLRLKPKHDATYVCAAINDHEFRREAERLSTGTTRTRISLSTLKRIKLKERRPEDEKRIGDIARTIDRAMVKTEALIEKYQQIKAGLMHDLFTRGLWTQVELDRGDHLRTAKESGLPAIASAKAGQLRPTRQDAPDLYQETPIGWIPKAWTVKTVESVGGHVTSGSRDWAKFYSTEGDLFVRIGNLTREHINFRLEKIQFVTPPRNSDGQRTKLVPGDLLVSITADLGIVGVIPIGFGDAYINQHIALVRFPQNVVNPRFAANYMASSSFQAFVDRLNDSGAKAGLNLPAVRGFRLPFPNKSEQDAIADRVDGIDKRVETEKRHLTKLQRQKAGLMHDLLTGEVPVTPDT